jgi:putative endonuclease
MTTTSENQAATTMSEEELRQTALGLCTDYLQGRGWHDVNVDGNRIVATDGGEVVLVTVRTTMTPGSEALPTLDLADDDVAAMRRECLLYLADHGDVEAIRHDAISIAITGERRAKLRHLVGVWQWAERM